jgi:hypothetical protein
MFVTGSVGVIHQTDTWRRICAVLSWVALIVGVAGTFVDWTGDAFYQRFESCAQGNEFFVGNSMFYVMARACAAATIFPPDVLTCSCVPNDFIMVTL